MALVRSRHPRRMNRATGVVVLEVLVVVVVVVVKEVRRSCDSGEMRSSDYVEFHTSTDTYPYTPRYRHTQKKSCTDTSLQ